MQILKWKKDFLNIVIHYLNDEKVAGVQTRVKMYNKDENFLLICSMLNLKVLEIH